MMVTCLNFFSKFECTVFKKLSTITYNHFPFSCDSCIYWPILFYGEMDKDDGNMLKKFQVNPIDHLRDMDQTIMLQDCHVVLQDCPRFATWWCSAQKMGSDPMFSIVGWKDRSTPSSNHHPHNLSTFPPK